ncbi:hypothetical protein [Sorangium sp. So ce124]|uniref:hypothetical protein n=1 Tax=Sorangium sp. So ce124 TaxID=3133280 RepID=UPI003F61DCE3
MPLVARDRLLGVISWSLPNPLQPAGSELASLAALFAVGLDSALVRQKSARAEAQVDAVRRSISDIGEDLDGHVVLARIADRTRAIAAAEYAALGVYAGDDAPFDPWIGSSATTGWARSTAVRRAHGHGFLDDFDAYSRTWDQVRL